MTHEKKIHQSDRKLSIHAIFADVSSIKLAIPINQLSFLVTDAEYLLNVNDK